MKRGFILIIVFAFTSLTNANNIIFNEIVIPKNYKTENTFSGDLSDTDSFHLIFTKNKKTKTYKVFSYLFNGNTTTELPSLLNEKSCEVVSFHKKNNILSLLLSYKIKKKFFIRKVDYNLKTKKKIDSEVTSHDDFVTSIRESDKSILIYKTDDVFRVSTYSGNEASFDKELSLEQNEDIKNFLKKQSVTSIKTDEFVANGATNTVRLYYEDNTLFFTRDSDDPLAVNVIGISLNNKKTNVTQLLKLDLNNENLVPEILTFENANGKKFKKATSFFTKDKLFQLALSKKQGFINIADVNTGKVLNNIPLNESMSKFTKGNSEFQGIEKFLKNAGKNKYNATITANKTKSNKIRLRVDYVDISYNYNYNWWWHHQMMFQHQQMMMQQNIQRSIPSGFGPRVPDDTYFENATITKEKRHFELLIDIEGNLLNEDLPEALYKEIDKKNYIKKLDENTKLKHVSSCFLKNSFRNISYNKKTKSFTINSRNL
jgi:hypothetical protein